MKKILIIRFSSIGDIVLTTPVIRCLKKHIPGVILHFLTLEAFAPVLKNNPYLDKIFAVNDNLADIITQLKDENYDLVIDLHHNIRSFRVKTALKKPSHSFNKKNIEKWLLVNINVNLLPKQHIVDRYLQTVSHLGVKYDGMGLDFFITAADKVAVNEFPAPWNNGYVGFVIGAKHETKKLPLDKISELIKQMKLPVVLIGGNDDEEAGDKIGTFSEGYSFNACGKYNLQQSASIVKQAKAIITHDTGLMHIAAAFAQKIVSVWGNTVPQFGMYPLLPENNGLSVIAENNNLNCRPCSKIGFDRCPKSHFNCMREIDTIEIARIVNDWWVDEKI